METEIIESFLESGDTQLADFYSVVRKTMIDVYWLRQQTQSAHAHEKTRFYILKTGDEIHGSAGLIPYTFVHGIEIITGWQIVLLNFTPEFSTKENVRQLIHTAEQNLNPDFMFYFEDAHAPDFISTKPGFHEIPFRQAFINKDLLHLVVNKHAQKQNSHGAGIWVAAHSLETKWKNNDPVILNLDCNTHSGKFILKEKTLLAGHLEFPLHPDLCGFFEFILAKTNADQLIIQASAQHPVWKFLRLGSEVKKHLFVNISQKHSDIHLSEFEVMEGINFGF